MAVMVNNVEKAMPQYGIGQADIIFEIPVEGDVTRFMALYGDYTKVSENLSNPKLSLLFSGDFTRI